MVFDIGALKLFLNSQSITYDLDDDALELLIDNQIAKIQSYTGCEILPVSHRDVELNYNQNSSGYNLKHYPVKEIIKVTIDNKNISCDAYVLDKENGRLQFLEKYEGTILTVNYITQESESFIKNKITPLLYDMIINELDTSPTKNASSIKEGDLSVNYDTSTSLNTLIMNRLNDLKNSKRKVITRML